MSFKSTLAKVVPSSFKPFLLNLYLKVTAQVHKGDQVECPCCKGQFKKFLSFDGYGKKRENARCPKCGSLERHRLLWRYMTDKLGILEKVLKVLHIAPEPGIQDLLQPLKNIDYLSADIVHPLAMVKMDITNIQYPDESFDSIICAHVLNHVDDDEKAMRELHRVLKPGGWAIIQCPVDYNQEQTFEDRSAKTAEERIKVFGQEDLIRIYGKDFIDRLKGANFTVNLDYYAKDLGPEQTARLGLLDEDEIYFCTKN